MSEDPVDRATHKSLSALLELLQHATVGAVIGVAAVALYGEVWGTGVAFLVACVISLWALGRARSLFRAAQPNLTRDQQVLFGLLLGGAILMVLSFAGAIIRAATEGRIGI